jgi:SNF2 family DNA or RNA helicase
MNFFTPKENKPLDKEPIVRTDKDQTIHLEKLIQDISSTSIDNTKTRMSTPDQLNVTLLEHQKIGLEWMIKSEKTNRGGILADDMGLGKTIQSIALILSNPSRGITSGTTLIVAPLSLLFQWQKEIQSKVYTDLKILMYHGSGRSRIDNFDTYDIVLTTYGTLSSDCFISEKKVFNDLKRKNLESGTDLDIDYDRQSFSRGALFNYRFHRVILDEAHLIKNHKSLVSVASSRLSSKYRWCLTGTPIQNSILDLFGLFRFLKIKPYCDIHEFNYYIARNMKKNKTLQQKAINRVRVVLKSCLLRRTKTEELDGQIIVSLPDKTQIVTSHSFSPDEQSVYNVLFEQAKVEFNRFITEGSVMKNYSHILTMILRLRQACLHPSLVIQPQNNTPDADGYIHVKKQVDPDSTKISKISAIVSHISLKTPSDKIIIFSQFTSFLDLLGQKLSADRVSFRQFDGRLDAQQRQQVLNDFKDSPYTNVLLISIKCGSLGLNLVSANHVLIADIWWNPAIEQQAIDRVHRLGQQKSVTVYRIFIENSIEDRILELQSQKKELSDGLLLSGKISDQRLSKLSVADLVSLFQ